MHRDVGGECDKNLGAGKKFVLSNTGCITKKVWIIFTVRELGIAREAPSRSRFEGTVGSESSPLDGDRGHRRDAYDTLNSAICVTLRPGEK
jgi:hypothetical protein